MRAGAKPQSCHGFRRAPTEGHDWIFRSYEVRTGSKPDKDAKSSFGFFLTGAGTAWFDDVRVGRVAGRLVNIENVSGVQLVNVAGGETGDVEYEFKGGRPKDGRP